jgi:hypothetical protein
VNLRARWDAHRRDLRRGLHHNPYLQHAWDRYGESDFELVVLEYVEVARLLDTEQLWIDRTGCINRQAALASGSGEPGWDSAIPTVMLSPLSTSRIFAGVKA